MDKLWPRKSRSRRRRRRTLQDVGQYETSRSNMTRGGDEA